MPAISEAKLQKLRALFVKKACDKECTIKRPVLVDDAYGSQSETLVVIAVAMVLIKKPDGGMLQNYSSLVASKAVHLIEFPYGQDVHQRDVLDFTGSNRELTVQEVLEPVSFSISTSALASEVK
jgi:hypothetical protein